MIKLGDIDISKIYLGETEITKMYIGDTEVYGSSEPTYDALTFILAEGEEGSVALNAVRTYDTNGFQYRMNSGEWQDYEIGTELSVVNGQTLQFQSLTRTYLGTSRSNYFQFVTNGLFYCRGNIMSLCNYNTEITQNYCFSNLFKDTSIMTAPELPATTLADYCYYSMFDSCTSLVNAPELPATTLARNCYSSMFRGCSSLVNAPELPATTLASNCYSIMFDSCTSLVNAPSVLPATTLADYCYSSMFNSCTSLVNAPELPATTLADYCCQEMFRGCSNLSHIKAMFTTTPSTSYTNNWLNGAKNTTDCVFEYNPSATWVKSFTRGTTTVPSNWQMIPASE